MPAILPHAATEICRHSLGDGVIKEALLVGPMYTIDQCSSNGIFHHCESDYASALAVAKRKAAYPSDNIKAYGQMKVIYEQAELKCNSIMQP